MQPFAIGDLRIDRVEEICEPAMRPEDFLAGLSADAIERNLHWMAPVYYDVATGMAITSVHTWVVRTRHHNVLIDTCMGNDKTRPGTYGDKLHLPWIERLAKTGLRPEDLDFVMCTHLHADHVGWNTQLVDGRWVPTFPNARYIFARREYGFWETATGPVATAFGQACVYQDSVLPCMEAGLVQLVDDGFTLDDDLVVQDAPGHTEGNVIVRASSRGHGGLFVGDVIHIPLQVLYPDISTVVCQKPELATMHRRRVLTECAEHGHLLLPAHFAAPHYGRVTSDAQGFHFHPGA